MDTESRRRKIDQHLEAIRELEARAVGEDDSSSWPPSDFYLLWHLVVGMTLGGLGAAVSLIANGLAAPLFGKRALELIRVYLTFPMGDRALGLDDASVLAVGCVLYLFTGAVYGIIIHLVLTVSFADASRGQRFLVATGLGLAMWIVNFYLILSWLQPLLLGGNWIVSLVPPWVAAFTHLAFAWTIAVAESWGKFEPYRGR